MSRHFYRKRTVKFQRVPEGEEHHNHLLTEDDVREMRKLRRETGLPYFHIGDEFGVSAQVARNAITGVNWKCVMDVPPVVNGQSDIPLRPTYMPTIEEIDAFDE